MRQLTATLFLFCACAGARSDTVGVICPQDLREALAPWVELRQAQGHTIHVGDSPIAVARSLAPALRAEERLAVLLVGDGGVGVGPSIRTPARVVWRYGPERLIPTDAPYGDFDGDGHADATVSRLPFSSKAALAAYVTRLVNRESEATTKADLRLQIVAGEAGFSPLIDAAIEATATRLLGALAPEESILSLRRVPDSAGRVAISERGGVSVWLGHGLRDQLPGVPRDALNSIVGRADVALLLACYAGDCGAPGRCVAEQLLASADGPLAVIAATGVSMPYGNSRLGAELLLGANRSTTSTWTEILQTAKRASLHEASSPDLEAIDTLAQLLGGSRDQLLNERVDHAALYQYFGDPLLRPRRPRRLPIAVTQEAAQLSIKGRSPIAGRLTVEVRGVGKLAEPNATATRRLAAHEAFEVHLAINARSTSARVRAIVDGPAGLSAGVATMRMAARGDHPVATKRSSIAPPVAASTGAAF